MYCVYMHTFPNGKVYIGITSQEPERRWRIDGSGYKGTSLMSNAIKKYGWENVKHDILFSGLSREQAEAKEVELIALYKSNQREYGYNVKQGGDINHGFKLSEETRRKMSEARKGEKNHWYGKHLPEELRQKLSVAHKGKTINKEAIMRGALKRRGKNAYNARKVWQCTKTGEKIKMFDSMADARNETGASLQDIYNCCVGRQKTAHGYKWEYV